LVLPIAGIAMPGTFGLTSPASPLSPSGSRRQSPRVPEAASTSSIKNPALRRGDLTLWAMVKTSAGCESTGQ
jgi:hypothetical protein